MHTRLSIISSFMEKILISACLIGDKTKYDGGDNKNEELMGLLEFFELVPFCPEMEGGLPCPRFPSERKGSSVFNSNGDDVTNQFYDGANKALRACSYFNITLAILKEGSPSCGTHEIYDGYFRDKKILGEGVTAQVLRSHGIRVMNETEALEFLKKKQEHAQNHQEYLARRAQAAAEEEERRRREEERRNQPKPHGQFERRGPKKPYKPGEKKHGFSGDKKPYRPNKGKGYSKKVK